MRWTDLIKHLLPGNEHKNFHDNPTNKHNAYDLRHLTVNLRVCGLKLRFDLQSSPMEGIFPQQDSNKISWQILHIIEVPLSPPHFLCEEILFKLLAFSYAITRKSEESSRRKSLPVLYTPSVGPSRPRILSPLIHKEEQWFWVTTRKAHGSSQLWPDTFWWLPESSTNYIKNSFQLPRRTLTPCHISNDRAWVHVCNLNSKPKISDPYSKFNVQSKNNAHMQLLLSFITCQCICFSIFNGVTSLKQIPFCTEKKLKKYWEDRHLP